MLRLPPVTGNQTLSVALMCVCVNMFVCMCTCGHMCIMYVYVHEICVCVFGVLGIPGDLNMHEGIRLENLSQRCIHLHRYLPKVKYETTHYE